MLVLKSTDYNLGENAATEAVILGNAMVMRTDDKKEVAWLDLTDKDACYKKSGHIKALGFMSSLFNKILPNSINWGTTETAYKACLGSDDWQLRRLVAMNCLFAKQLCCDEHYLVRTAAVQAVIKASLDQSTPNNKFLLDDARSNNWLDPLIYDSSRWVRLSLAELGFSDHLEQLAYDEDELVARNAIAKTTTRQLTELVDDTDPKIRMATLLNPNISLEQLVILEYDDDEEVVVAVAAQGHTTDNLMQSHIRKVRLNVAIHGDFDKVIKMAADKDSTVRERIAHRGIAHDLLYKDEDYFVRRMVAIQASLPILERMEAVGDSDWRIMNIIKERIRSHISYKPSPTT